MRCGYYAFSSTLVSILSQCRGSCGYDDSQLTPTLNARSHVEIGRVEGNRGQMKLTGTSAASDDGNEI